MSHPSNSRGKTGIILLVLAIALVFVGSHFVRLWLKDGSPGTEATTTSYQRVVALSPSIVEIVYELGIDEHLVGVSKFCNYPPEAAEKQVVGGYLDLDFEAVLDLEVDCVILLEEQELLAKRFEELGIPTIVLDHASTEGILDSIPAIGEPFGRGAQATETVRHIRERLADVTSRVQQIDPKPRILVCIDRDSSSSTISRLIGAGQSGVHQEYLRMAGGTNAYIGPAAYPAMSREKLIHIDPDIIIDLNNEQAWREHGGDKLLSQWKACSELRAVRNDHVVIFHEHRHMIPGPRFVETVEAFADVIESYSSTQSSAHE